MNNDTISFHNHFATFLHSLFHFSTCTFPSASLFGVLTSQTKGSLPHPHRRRSELANPRSIAFNRRSLPSTPQSHSPRLANPLKYLQQQQQQDKQLQQQQQRQQEKQARFLKYANEIFASKLPSRISFEEDQEEVEKEKGVKEEDEDEEKKMFMPSLKRNRRIATPGSLHLHPDLEGKYADYGKGG